MSGVRVQFIGSLVFKRRFRRHVRLKGRRWIAISEPLKRAICCVRVTRGMMYRRRPIMLALTRELKRQVRLYERDG
jgi:hypothetical protein